MTVWVLIWIVSSSGFSGYQGNETTAIATGSTIFHSQDSCEKAASRLREHGNKASCFEDKQ